MQALIARGGNSRTACRNPQRPRRTIRGPVPRRVLQGGAASEPATAPPGHTPGHTGRTCAPAPETLTGQRPASSRRTGQEREAPPGLERAGMDVRRSPPPRTGKAGGAARTRTGDGGFADLCLATWRRRRQDGGAGGARRQPLAVTRRAGAAVRAWRGVDRPRRRKVERETGFEPATSTMARSHSTTELFPLAPNAPSTVPQGDASLQDPCQAGRAPPPQRRPAGVPAPRRRHPCQADRAPPRQRRGSDRLRTWSRWPSRSGRCAEATARQRPAPDAAPAARTQRRSRRPAPGR